MNRITGETTLKNLRRFVTEKYAAKNSDTQSCACSEDRVTEADRVLLNVIPGENRTCTKLTIDDSMSIDTFAQVGKSYGRASSFLANVTTALTVGGIAALGLATGLAVVGTAPFVTLFAGGAALAVANVTSAVSERTGSVSEAAEYAASWKDAGGDSWNIAQALPSPTSQAHATS